ncbi:MAG: ATP-binding protein [Gammaproteobacteria bacterium]
MDASVIAAIQGAVQADPGNLALRAHLVSLLAQGSRWAEVAEHCALILERQPDHLEALRYAGDAAAALGDTARAEGLRRLHRALAGAAPPPASAPPPAKAKVVPLRVVGNDRDDEDDEPWGVEGPSVTLHDVAGMDHVKRRLNIAFLAPMQNPELRKMFGKSLRGGLLLYGPPGCGKTFIARATAGELKARFLSVGLADVLDMWLGNSEKNLREIFQTARRKAPCVLFLDEVDALGRKRSQTRHAGANVINQLLAEMDGVDQANEGVFVLAATNHPWDVDTALRRPGRLDRTVLVLPPDRPARVGILAFHLRDRPVQDVDLEWLAGRTDDYSGADLAHLCESAAELAMEDSIARGGARPIGQSDFKRALKEVKPSTRAWLETARNYAMFANEGGVYDDLLEYLRVKRLL